jgi:hypothetical protein
VDDSPTLWCPSCGAEYRPGTNVCADCRVGLAGSNPQVLSANTGGVADDESLVELGEWPRLHAQILRRRLESASVPVMIEFSGTGANATGVIVVPEEHSDFAWAVVNEIEVEDEVPDTSPYAYLTRIEEHMSAAAGLLEELRTRLDQLEADGKL